MSNHYLFDNLTTVKDLSKSLAIVIDDKEKEFDGIELLPLKNDGKIIYHFAIDAHEIGQYCFPLDIDRTYKQQELEKVVDSQIAYYDIFNQHNRTAIIFNDYKKELEGTKDYFRSFNENAKREGNLSLYKAFRENIENITYHPDATRNAEHTDFVVAFNLALISFGVDRFNEIYPKKIIFESDYNEDDLLSSLVEYHINEKYFRKICNDVKKSISITNENSLIRDVLSIGKIFFLNNYFIKNNYNNRIIYFSSAPRTKHIISAFEKFKHDEDSLFVDFSPWRTPIQIYLYLMLREIDDSENIKVDATLDLLKRVKGWFEELDASSYSYPRNQEISYEFERLLSQRKEKHLQNLNSVESSQLGKIASLYELTSGKNKAEIEKNIKIYFKDDKEKIEEYLKKLTPQGIDVDVLLRQIEVDLKLRDVISYDFAKNDDVITNCYNTYPFLLFIENEKYKDIIDKLFDYWIEYYQKNQHQAANTFERERILKILHDFLELDKELTSRTSDYYTTSTMLHLVNPRKNSDGIANDYIKKLEKYNRIEENKNLLYLKANILRRLNSYNESIEICDKYKDADFRFGYCKALALIGLLHNATDAVVTNQMGTIESAINDLILTFNRIENLDVKEKKELKCSICSNIIYLASMFYLHSIEEQNIQAPSEHAHEALAKKYLDILKGIKSKENGEWDFLFPDYFHSEAFYEYSTIYAYVQNGQKENFPVIPKSGEWIVRLNSALADLDKAISYSTVQRKKDFYQSLKAELLKLKERL